MTCLKPFCMLVGVGTKVQTQSFWFQSPFTMIDFSRTVSIKGVCALARDKSPVQEL